MSRPRIVLDCDPGIDDAFAILAALRWCDLIAITTVGGNVGIEHTTRNALAMVQIAGADTPVHAGAASPLAGSPDDARDVHGDSGMGGVEIPALSSKVASDDAVAALLDLVVPGVTLVAVGPLTNLALALQADPSWAQRVDEIVLMGGSTGAGNVTAAAEFNIWFDPEAAAIVFESGIPVTMVGLNLTQQVRMGANEIAVMRDAGSAPATFVADALEYYTDYAARHYGIAKSAMHDPCAVLRVSHPELFESQRHHVAVETQGRHTRGMTLVDHRAMPAEPNADVLITAEAERVVELIVDAAISPLS